MVREEIRVPGTKRLNQSSFRSTRGASKKDQGSAPETGTLLGYRIRVVERVGGSIQSIFAQTRMWEGLSVGGSTV